MSATKTHYGYRQNPQLSAAQIAEYLVCSASRRTSIIRAARFPKKSIVAQYTKAREGLTSFLGDDIRSARHFTTAIDYLTKREARPGATPWVIRDSRSSVEAIETFQRSYNRSPLPKVLCRVLHGRQLPLVFGPTKISVDLDVVAVRAVPGEAAQIGGVVFLFSKGEKSTKARIVHCKTIAGLAYVLCGTHLTAMGKADPSLCFAVDVFESKLHTPPGTFTRKLKQIADSCDEIGARWKSVSPPSDYDGPDPS